MGRPALPVLLARLFGRGERVETPPPGPPLEGATPDELRVALADIQTAIRATRVRALALALAQRTELLVAAGEEALSEDRALSELECLPLVEHEILVALGDRSAVYLPLSPSRRAQVDEELRDVIGLVRGWRERHGALPDPADLTV
jgi:hypothetical protein